MATPEKRRGLCDTVQKALEKHSQSNDPKAYELALAAIQRLQLAVEKPGDFAARVRFQGLQNIAFLQLAEMGVLQAIAARKGQKVTSEEIAEETKCDELLIRRLLRLITAVGICDEIGEYTYCSNAMTDVLVTPGQIAGMRYMVEEPFHIGSQIRNFMRTTQVHKGQSLEQNACQFAFDGKSFWQLLSENADRRTSFNEYMKSPRRGGQLQLWHQRYPPASKLKDEKLKDGPDAFLMVDVGGGVGNQVGAFRKQYPDLPGRCVLQELPETIQNNSSPPDNVESIPYDFFTPQPLRGARIYLFRSVCHDWNDAQSRQLLSNTVTSMDAEYSRLVIDEWVLPDQGASLIAASKDISMMLVFDAMERTRKQWTKLLDDVGLEIVDIFPTPGASESVIETRVKRQVSNGYHFKAESEVVADRC